MSNEQSDITKDWTKTAYESRTCPKCGKTVKKLPTHLRNTCEKINDD